MHEPAILVKQSLLVLDMVETGDSMTGQDCVIGLKQLNETNLWFLSIQINYSEKKCKLHHFDYIFKKFHGDMPWTPPGGL